MGNLSSGGFPRQKLDCRHQVTERTRKLQLQPIPKHSSGSAYTHGRAHTAAAAAAQPLLCLGLPTQKRQSPHRLLEPRHLSHAPPCTGHFAFSAILQTLFFPIKQSLAECTKLPLPHHKCPCRSHSSQEKEHPNLANTGSHLSSSLKGETFSFLCS